MAKDYELLYANFDIASLQLGVYKRIASIVNLANNLNNVFATKFASTVVDFYVVVCSEDNLSLAVTVAKVNKN